MEHVTDEQLSLLLDGELSLTSRDAVRAHLSLCPSCAARHDALVEVAAGLRLQPRVDWTPVHTGQALARLDGTRRGARSLAPPIVAALGVVAMLLLALVGIPLINAALTIAGSSARALESLLPAGLGTSPGTGLSVLLAAALLGPLLAYPLARWR